MHLPWHDVAPGDGAPPISTSITGAEAAELGRLAAGEDVLEVGSAYGFSACVMALAGARHVMAVDPHGWLNSRPVMDANLRACGVAGQVAVIQAPSGDILPELEPGSFGLVFIDGDHGYGAVLADVKAALPLLRPGGRLACHDYGEDCCCAGVRQALDELFPEGPEMLTDTLFVVQAPA